MASRVQGTITWGQWFNTPPSEIERLATNSFVKAGLEVNRFVAVPRAIPAIVISSMMIVGNPVGGILKGSVVLFEGKVGESLWEVGAGIGDMGRSLLNVACVFWTAILGLVAREMMYSAMKVHEVGRGKEQQAKETETPQEVQNAKEKDLEGQIQKLEKTLSELQEQKNKALEKLETLEKQLVAQNAANDPTTSEQYQALLEQKEAAKKELEVVISELKAMQGELKGLTARHKAELEEAKDPAKNGLNQKIQELNAEHEKAIQELQKSHEKTLNGANEKIKESEQTNGTTKEELENAKKSVEELKQSHEKAMKEKEEKFARQLEEAKVKDLEGKLQEVNQLNQSPNKIGTVFKTAQNLEEVNKNLNLEINKLKEENTRLNELLSSQTSSPVKKHIQRTFSSPTVDVKKIAQNQQTNSPEKAKHNTQTEQALIGDLPRSLSLNGSNPTPTQTLKGALNNSKSKTSNLQSAFDSLQAQRKVGNGNNKKV